MSTNLSDLDPDSPEFEAALEAAQEAEDAEREASAQAEGTATDDTGDADENADPEAAKPAVVEAQEPAPEPAAAEPAKAAEPAAASPATPKVAGVSSKDGKTVLPYAALQAERRAARSAAGRAEAAERALAETRQQLEDLKAGKQPPPKASELEGMTEAELEEIKQDFPGMAKLVDVALATARQLAELKKAGKSAAGEAAATAEQDEEAEAEEAIDSNPVLLGWMTDPKHADKFERAKVLDRALEGSPKWKDKPLAERFAHVTKLVADEFDIELPKADTPEPEPEPQPQATKPPKADPTAALQKAQRVAPNTLSDFKGGSADPNSERIENLPAQRMLSRFEDMSDAEIDAHLAKFGG